MVVLLSHRRKTSRVQLKDEKVKSIFQGQLEKHLVSHKNDIDMDVGWNDIQAAEIY